MFNPQSFGQMAPGFGFRPSAYPQPVQQTAPQQSMVSYVTSRAQAEVAQIPFDGQPYFFFNTSTRELYGKAFDPQTGNCPLVDYVPAVQAAPPQYATVDMLAALEKRLEDIAGMIPQEPVRHPRTARREAEAE